MTVDALIKFDQGGLHPPAGQGLIGALTTPVTASNGNNTDVERWVYEWIATPTGSALLPGVISDGILPTTTFTPDVTGTYVLSLDVYDEFGNISHDVRCFSVLEPSGHLIPNFDADAASMNFGGQLFGWHPYLEQFLKTVDGTFGKLQKAMADADQTLTAADAAGRLVFEATGALTADRRLVFPVVASAAAARACIVKNSTTGGHNIVVDITGTPGTTVSIASGHSQLVVRDTSGVWNAVS